MKLLKQSTASTVIVGPVLDANGAAVTTAVVGDFKLAKNGTTATLSGATVTHDANGYYTIALTTGNTDTVGRLVLYSGNTAQSMATHYWTVLLASVFDALLTNATNTTGGLATATAAISAFAGAISTYAGGAVASVTAAVTVGTNNDKTGYSLSSSQTFSTTGSVGSVTGAVGSVTARVTANTDQWNGVTVTGMPMPTYTQPTGFLAATFPATVSSLTAAGVRTELATELGRIDVAVSSRLATSGYTAPDNATISTISSNLVTVNNNVLTRSSHTAADVWTVATRTLTAFAFSVTVGTNNDKTGYSLTAGTGLGNQTANITGNLSGSVGSVSGSVGSISGVTFPANFGSLLINVSGHVSRVVLVDTTTTNTDMRGTDNAALASAWTATRAGYLDSVLLAANSNQRTVQVTGVGSGHIAADIHAFQADVLTDTAIAASAVTKLQAGLATINNQTTINTNVLSRLAASAYTAPDNTGIAAIKVVTDRVNTGLVADGAVWQFTVNMLENGPGGGGGGSATIENQELILDQLDLIQGKTDLITSSGAITGLLAGAVLEPGTIEGFPTTLKIGDSYTAANGRAIDIPIVDTDGIPLDSAGSLDFSSASVTFTISRAKETSAARIVTGTATVIDPPGTGTANAPYVRVELSSSETAKGLLGYRYTATLKFTWAGTGTDVMSFESSADITFDN